MRSAVIFSAVLFMAVYGLGAQPQLSLQPFVSNLNLPVGLAHAGDERLFVVEKQGRIRIIDGEGQLLAAPFLDISDRVRSSSNEQGLLGLAFHPGFAANGYFYVNYTNGAGDTHVSRFSVDPANPDQGLPASEKVLLTVDQPFTNHNGGDLHFGPDGYLYIALGDGGSGDDPRNNAQTRTTLLGKLLRIDVDNGDPYAIPPDNPFADDDFTLDEIWALGLRNPWRFSFDRQTGDLWIADVGQNEWEEIDFEAAGGSGGLNYGWRCYEGPDPYITTDCGEANLYTPPIHAYRHRSGGCGGSVTGGFVYRGQAFPMLQGRYLYADYCTGKLFALRPQTGGTGWVNEELLAFAERQIVAFGEDLDGEMYLVAIGRGIVYRIVEQCASLPVPTISEENAVLSVPDTFQTYRWFRDGESLPGADAPQLTATTSGAYSAVLTTANGCDLFTAPVTVVITSANSLPGLNFLKLAPNPAGTEVYLNFSTDTPMDVDLQVYDGQGKLWRRFRRTLAGSGAERLALDGLPAGIYVLRIANGEGALSRRLVVE